MLTARPKAAAQTAAAARRKAGAAAGPKTRRPGLGAPRRKIENRLSAKAMLKQ
jgi:hypothetical protein